MFQLFSKEKQPPVFPKNVLPYLESVSRKRGRNKMSVPYQQAREAIPRHNSRLSHVNVFLHNYGEQLKAAPEISNAEIQNSKKLHFNQTVGQQRHAAKAIEDQIIRTLNQKSLTEIIQVSTKEYLHQSLVAIKQQEKAKKMEQEN